MISTKWKSFTMEQRFDLATNESQESRAVAWYKSLTIEQRFALKDLSATICGISWQDFSLIFSPRERIEILHEKLLLEGFAV